MKRSTLFVLVLVTLTVISLVAASRGPLAECRDGVDNDGDTLTDWPADPGCHNKNDDDESNCGDNVCEGGESTETCPADCPAVPVCGDGVVEGDEVCDGSDLNNETCVSQGFDGGSLECNSECNGFNTNGCYTNSCSDSDGGFETGVQGTVSGEANGVPYNNTDNCLDSEVLVEWYCFGAEPAYNSLNCATNSTSGTCMNGACV